ncbi:MAG: glycoside hydrolase family 127 protein [Planctomycetes bacterium]|nr:glycoside hydrolase family 127 protein [Planctomycetota bacterium]
MILPRLSLVFILSLLASNAWAQGALHPLDLREIKVAGSLGHRIDLTVAKNILVIDHEKSFLRYFRERNRPPFAYVGLGKEIDALVRLAYYTSDPRLLELKTRIVQETIKTQLEDGYIGIFADDRLKQWWDLHELSYIVYALVQDYRYFGSQESLAAAKRAGDYMMEHRAKRRLVFHVSTIGLERAFLALQSATGDAKYLAHVNYEESLAQWQADVGGHAYDYLNLCVAQLDLYERRADTSLLRQAHHAMEYLTAKNGLLVNGTCSHREGWHTDQTGTGDTGETCATSYLIRLWDKLLQAEGKSLYGDLMERAIYNALFAAQSTDGRELRKYTPLEGPRQFYQGEAGSDFQRDTYCCPNNYRRTIADLPGLIYYRAADAVVVNLYCASQATVRLDKNLTVNLVQETDYPNSGGVRLLVNPSKPAEFAVKLRIPRWCNGASVRINGQPGDCSATPGEFCAVRRTWKSGDVVELQMPMPVRVLRGRASQDGKVAVIRGPLLFCFNPRLNADQEPALAGQHGDRGRKRGELVAQFNSVEAQLLVPDDVPASSAGTPNTTSPERQALLARRSLLEKEIANYRKIEDVLREVKFDLGSVSGPISDSTVRADGLALRIKAWSPGADRTAPPNLILRLTEFADPGGELTYFATDQPTLGVEDDLLQPRLHDDVKKP